MRVTTHMWLRQPPPGWAAEGGYDFVAEALLNELEVDGFCWEWDDERSGGFEPLRFLPKSASGLVPGSSPPKRRPSSSRRRLRRIDEARATHRSTSSATPTVQLLHDDRGQRAH